MFKREKEDYLWNEASWSQFVDEYVSRHSRSVTQHQNRQCIVGFSPSPTLSPSTLLPAYARVPLSRRSGGPDLASEEARRGAGGVTGIEEVSRKDEEGTPAHGVASLAVDLGPGGGVSGNASQVLQILRVAKEDGADDAVADARVEPREGVADNCRALAAKGKRKRSRQPSSTHMRWKSGTRH